MARHPEHTAVDASVDVDALHRVGRALSDPTRCRMLLCLLERPHYPSELADHLGLSRANASNHLACLRECGLVVARREGRRQRYELVDPRLAHALDDLSQLSVSLGGTSAHLDEGAA